MKMRERRVMPTTATAEMIEPALILLETMPRGTPDRDKKLIAAIWRTMCEGVKPAINGGLTRLQLSVHEIIADYIDEHGISPTYQEIADMIGRRKKDVFEIVYALKRRGVVRIDQTTGMRQIRLLFRPNEEMPRPRKDPLLPPLKQRKSISNRVKQKINPPSVSSEHQQPETDENGTEERNA